MAVDRKRPSRKSGRQRSGGGGGLSGVSGGGGVQGSGLPGQRSTGSQRHQQSNDRVQLSTAAKCKSYCRQFLAFLFSHVGLCALVVGYAIGGALIFQRIEAPHEDKLTTVIKVAVLRNRTLEDLWNITTELNVFSRESWSAMTERRVLAFQSGLVKHIKDEGYDGTLAGQWTFSGSFLFALTVITTIGYGNIAPRTNDGKIMTIFYAIFGIPLMLLYLTNIGGILAKAFRFMYGRFCTCKPKAPSAQERRAALLARSRSIRLKQRAKVAALAMSAAGGGGGGALGGFPTAGPSSSAPHTPMATLNRSQPSMARIGGGGAFIDPSSGEFTGLQLGRSLTDPSFDGGGGGQVPDEDTDSDEMDDLFDDKANNASKAAEQVHVPISLSLMILISYVSGGGALFSIWEEEWGYLEGSYFCFISLSTIGFGDLVPGNAVVSGEGGSQERMVICSLYLLTGLALIAMCFNLMQEEVVHKVRKFGKRVGIIKDPEEEYDDELDVP